MKSVIVIGGGIAGCSVAYFLKNKGYDVKIIEKNKIGGLCITDEMGGISYEFGPHICYAQQDTPAFELFHKLLPEFKAIKYFPKQSMDGEIDNLVTFPITVSNVLKLPVEEQVKAIEELYHVNLDKPDYDNFEKYIISRVGETMYKYCYKNYNRKQWGMEPKDMDSEWARFRNFYLRAGDFGMFGDLWQGHPGSYNNFFERLVNQIEIIRDEVMEVRYEGRHVSAIKAQNGEYKADMFVSTLPIDFLVNQKDELEYRGIAKFYYLLKGKSGLPTYLCTFPNNYCWTRITDYSLQAEQDSPNSLISIAIPHSSRDKKLETESWGKEAEEFIERKMKKEILDRRLINYNYVYPISSSAMLKKFDNCITQVSEVDNLITFGRLGLYSYISMCTAINQAAKVAENIEKIPGMTQQERYVFYKHLREKLS